MRTQRRITRSDAEWPARLNELGPDQTPMELFLEGRELSVGEKTIAIVGSRHPTGAGIEAAKRFASGIAEAGFGVVSGLAMGIDSVAHRAALDAGGYTVAVLGCGLDTVYPARNKPLFERIRSEGTLVSEYPEGVPPSARNFPVRNRIVSGLSTGVLVVEGGFKSGALITARLALDANKSVWAVPGSLRNPMAHAPNQLIRTGQAGLVTELQHIFEELAPGLIWNESKGSFGPAPDLPSREKDILCLMDDTPITLDRICAELHTSMGSVALDLSRMEVRGFIRRRGPGYEISEAGARIRSALLLSD